MSEQSLTLKSPGQFAPAQLAREYFEHGLSAVDLATAEMVAKSFEVPGKPLADTIVCIPVLAHQDYDRVYTAMKQYDKQTKCEPFSILLYINVPNNEVMNPHTKTASDEVRRAQHAFPGLDIRTAFKSYEQSTIGRIRADCWNGGALLAEREGKFEAGRLPIIGLNHDIDTEYISSSTMSRVQMHYRSSHMLMRYSNGRRLLPTAIRVSHRVLPSHPNVGAVTTWRDESIFQYPQFGFYEAGLAVPFDYYLEQGGFKDCIMGEAVELVNGRIDRKIKGTHLLSSPRRQIDRLPAHSMEEVWTAESFGSGDVCRERLHADIDFGRAEELIAETLPHDICSWLARPILAADIRIRESHRNGKVQKDAEFYNKIRTRGHQQAERRILAAQSFMEQAVGSVALARCLPEIIDYQSHVSAAIEHFIDAQNGRSKFD